MYKIVFFPHHIWVLSCETLKTNNSIKPIIISFIILRLRKVSSGLLEVLKRTPPSGSAAAFLRPGWPARRVSSSGHEKKQLNNKQLNLPGPSRGVQAGGPLVV